MSAFIVSKAHIDALVDVATNGPGGVAVRPDNAWHFSYYLGGSARIQVLRDGLDAYDGERTPSQIGAVLVAENVRSVEYRYDSTTELPGPCAAYYREEYSFKRPRRSRTAVETLAALACYEYQACEGPEWESSEAFKICQALRLAVIRYLPGYDAAGWSIEEDEALAS